MMIDREKTEEGSPLIDVVKHGIERPVHATDCFCVLLKELRMSGLENACRTAVIIDGLNTVFGKKSYISPKLPDRTKGPFYEKNVQESLEINQFAMVRALKKFLR